MEIRLIVLAAAVLFSTGATSARADSDDIPLQPFPKNAENVAYTGTWSYTTSDHKVAGRCPNGRPMAGELSITQDDALAQVLLVSGAMCVPAFSCVFTGVIEDGDLIVANSGIVDDEGGKVTNEMRIYFFSETSGGAQSVSVYTHPGGFACEWTHQVTLSR